VTPPVLDPTPSVSQIVLSCTSPSVRPYTLGVTDCTILHLSRCQTLHPRCHRLYYLPPLQVLDPTPSVSQIVQSCTSPGVKPYTLGVTDCTILHLSRCQTLRPRCHRLYNLAPLPVLDPTPSVSQIVLSYTSPSVRPYTLGVTDCTILYLSQG
jgi:hypothetical protein